jgi:hypothetical protein
MGSADTVDGRYADRRARANPCRVEPRRCPAGQVLIRVRAVDDDGSR